MNSYEYGKIFRARAIQLRDFKICGEWRRMGVSPTDAAEWANMGFLPAEAAEHIDAGVTPEMYRVASDAEALVEIEQIEAMSEQEWREEERRDFEQIEQAGVIRLPDGWRGQLGYE